LHRVARTVIPLAVAETGNTRGLEDRQVNLGCVMPGESSPIFSDALRRLASAATYLYQDGPRYWYSTQPTVTKLADDRAEQLKCDQDKVAQEIDRRLRLDLRDKGEFSRVHPVPQSSQDVPEDFETRLVVLGIDHLYSREPGNAAKDAAKAILESRGSAPRLYRNTLVFLAADKTRMQDLEEAVRRYLAWQSIVAEAHTLNLDPQQVRQAETQEANADGVIAARLPETYQWLLVPTQSAPQVSAEWQSIRLTGQETLAGRASKKLRNEELLVTALAGSRLRMELDRVPLWRGDYVPLKQLAEDFARYLYLPRLRDSRVLATAVQDGLGLLLWQKESFAYADSYDEAAGRYRGLRCGKQITGNLEALDGVLVKPDVALRQQEGELPPPPPPPPPPPEEKQEQRARRAPKRFHGTVQLDSTRVGRDAGQIQNEVIAHLVALVGSPVNVTLEIEAIIPGGAPENVVRTVTENSRTLKFTTQEFEEE
jgi:hypothetical protein